MKYSLRTLFLITTVIALLLALWVWRDYLPGTFHRDASGFPHGTGVEEFHYEPGQLHSRWWHRAGILVRAAWYRPDGSLIADIKMDIKTGGDNLNLREDGSIEWRIPCKYDPHERLFFAEGQATHYDEEGNIIGTSEYRHGVKVGK
jgi:hypothetical protein